MAEYCARRNARSARNLCRLLYRSSTVTTQTIRTITPTREPAIMGVDEGVCMGPGSEPFDAEDVVVDVRVVESVASDDPDDVLAEYESR